MRSNGAWGTPPRFTLGNLSEGEAGHARHPRPGAASLSLTGSDRETPDIHDFAAHAAVAVSSENADAARVFDFAGHVDEVARVASDARLYRSFTAT